MLGIHDMGGMHGFGPVVVDDSPSKVFHASWEARTFALNLLGAHYGVWGTSADQVRHAIERIGNVVYLNSSYYERWLHAWEPLMLARGFVGEIELRARQAAAREGREPELVMPAVADEETHKQSRELRKLVFESAPKSRDLANTPVYNLEHEVIVRRMPSEGHSRCPRYVWGCRGRVIRHHGGYVFPDAAGMGEGERPQHLYTVSFDGQELWGDAAEPNTTFLVDLWESYLKPAPTTTA